MTAPVLETRELCRHFGALAAVDGVSLAFEAGRVHAVIGPNGAGKTTLINLLSGELTPSRGTVHFKGQNVTGAPPHRIARLGIARSFQKTNIVPGFTCLENCWLGAHARLGATMGFFRPARRYVEVAGQAAAALDMCGLGHRRDTVATRMSFGEQRQLEIGVMLAAAPELLLLDEPLAGMGAEESVRLTGLLKDLARDHTLILVEHDMDAVFAIADVLTVMVDGRILETGSPDQIRRSPAVRDAYLGGGEDRP